MMSHSRTAFFHATAGVLRAHAQGEVGIEWQYHVRVDELGGGVASPVVAGADGAIYFGTSECVYNANMCVNATGELVKLDAKTGLEEWSVRFDGAGLTGALGFPQAPVLIGEPGKDFRAVVTGAETLDSGNGTFYYFGGSIPLGDDTVNCDVPLASGNRMPHQVDASTADECAALGGCWAAEGEDTCALVETAQTTPCEDVDNPVDEDTCAAKGCCFNGDYSLGWCFRPSPSCFKPAPAAHSIQQSTRPGSLWVSKPVPSQSGHVVVMADCGLYGTMNACGVGAYDTETTIPLWRVPLAASCDNAGEGFCVCSGSEGVPSPAVGQSAVFAVACSSKGVVLLGLSLETGQQVWPPQFLGDLFGPGDANNKDEDFFPPSPVWSSEHEMVYAAIFTSADTAKVNAYSANWGGMQWSTEVSGHACTQGFRWLDAAVVSRGTLLLWDNYTIRALHPPSGDTLWETSSSDFAVVLGSGAPTLVDESEHGEEAVVLVPISDAGANCSAMADETFFFAELALSDGTLRSVVEAPEGLVPASVTNPVAAGGMWVFSSTLGRPMQSIVFAIKAPAARAILV